MSNIVKNLSSMHKDALKEIGNIGAGNAATAFAQFLNKKIDMTVPSVEIKHMGEVPEITGSVENKVIAILLKVMGEAPGSILLLLSEDSTENLLEMIVHND